MKKILIIAVIVTLAGALYFFSVAEQEAPAESAWTETAVSAEALAEIANYEYTQEYSDSKGRFSFRYPAQFIVSAVPGESGEAILVQNYDTGIGVQILTTPSGKDADITAGMIREDIPGIRIEDVQVVEIGSNRKGVAFLSNNPEFGGRSRDVWFMYKKELYQITTYANQDAFLKGLFGTWKFFR